jgi:ribosomal-protein-alanine N-acetyltransferase
MKEDLLGVPETLQTSRLLLKRYQQGEGKLVYALIRDNKTRLQDHFPRTIAQITDENKAELYVRSRIADWYGQKGYFFGIWEQGSQTYIGQISVKNLDWEVPRAEIGYYISKEYEGRGLMTEVLKVIIRFSFEQLKVRKLFLRTTPSNVRSSKLAENCGFVKEGCLRKDFLKADKTLSDVIYYGITLQDFQAMK